MKSLRTPIILLVLLYLCFLGCWAWSASQLPERIATHFNLSGQPNGWMSRSANQWLVLLLSLFFPSLVVVLSYVARFVPGIVNIPDRDYWLAPERRKDTSNYLVRHSIWFACLAVWFVMGIEYSIVQANKQSLPHLSNSMLLLVLGPFLIGTAVWAAILLRHFRRIH
jgi:uncharacterized membrane protein